MAEHRSYYAIIPANIRYDTRLKANSKLLYGEITALCNEKGFCWASNDYFSQSTHSFLSLQRVGCAYRLMEKYLMLMKWNQEQMRQTCILFADVVRHLMLIVTLLRSHLKKEGYNHAKTKQSINQQRFIH